MNKYEKMVVKIVGSETHDHLFTELRKAFPELKDSEARQIVWNCVDQGILVLSPERTFEKGSVE